MKKIFTIITSIAFLFNTSFACDDATFSNLSVGDNGDGTYDITFDLCAEFLGLEGSPEWWGIQFTGGTFTSVVTATPASVTTSTGDVYNGESFLAGAAWRWRTTEAFPSNGTGTFCNTYVVTVNGLPSNYNGSYHDTYGGTCNFSGVIPQPCSISGISVGTQTACNPADNTYTQQLTVTYSDEPGSGNLVVNGQSFGITGSPQVVTLTGLDSDGSAVDVTAVFSSDASCTVTQPSLFTAPANCVCGAEAGSIN